MSKNPDHGRSRCWKSVFAGAIVGQALVVGLACAAAADNSLTAREQVDGWLLLFDGSTLNDWMTSAGKPSARPVEDGCINPHRCGHYMMVHTQQWSDFTLALDFKISPGCNSGIFVRTSSLTPLPGKDVGYHGADCWFKNIKLRPLTKRPAT